MIKYTPQEIANIFQCYVAADEDDYVFSLYENEPSIDYECDRWWGGNRFAEIEKDYLKIPQDYCWQRCYKPESVEIMDSIIEQEKEKIKKVRNLFISCYEKVYEGSDLLEGRGL